MEFILAIWNEQCPDCIPSCFDISYRFSTSISLLNTKLQHSILKL